jgi:hypothetical protein
MKAMRTKKQREWALKQLNNNGFITRNQCLENYISRLGALIYSLKKEGYVFITSRKKTPKGEDYVYTLVSPPPSK